MHKRILATPEPFDPAVFGQRVRTLRVRAGLTQVQLAAAAGIHQGGLSRIERGENIPTSPVLQGLARGLGVPVGALFAESREALRLVLRDQGIAPFPIDIDETSLPDDLARRAERIIDVFLELEDRHGAQRSVRVPLTLVTHRTETAVELAAYALRTYMQVQNGVLLDTFELLEAYGLRTITLPLPHPIEDFTYYDPHYRNAFLFVSSTLNPERQLFRLAYQFGLLCVFEGLGRASPHTRHDLSPAQAARRFAARFLLPADAVRSTVWSLAIQPDQWTWPLLLRLKLRFGASAEMFANRLNELELITPANYESLKAQISTFYLQHGPTEPGMGRDRHHPNGRLGDLLSRMEESEGDDSGLRAIQQTLADCGVRIA